MKKCYKRILVPLDGSSLAELALNDALPFAQICGGEIILLQVLMPVDHSGMYGESYPVFADDQWQNYRQSAEAYLQTIQARLQQENIESQIIIESGPPAETILEYARANDIDLIAMATHGRSGIKRWVYGSVADKVLRGANSPILLVRAGSSQS